MRVKNKIGWQKYEDLLQNQLESPFLDSLYSQMTGGHQEEEEDEEIGGYNDEYPQQHSGQVLVPINERLMENISLAANFECWMGHTNFNITPEVRDKLNTTLGVEVLKICSRYRFFVGIGKMFDFAEVRQAIEQTLQSESESQEGEPTSDCKKQEPSRKDRQVPE